MDALAQRIQRIRKPDPKLLWYYLLVSFAGLVFQPFVFVPLFFKYHTLEYHFDERGVRCSWGILFRREVYLTYGRIQDIHLTRNLLERWLGLGTVDVQTASGSAGAALSIVGLLEHQEVRDFLYGRMRGFKEHGADATAAPAGNELREVLVGIREELRAIRQALGERR
jgi:putative membrane protein